MPKIRRSELGVAEKKYQALIEKRDLLNTQAAAVAKERDDYNARKRMLLDRLAEVRTHQKTLFAEINRLKLLRSAYQRLAKEKLAVLRTKKKDKAGNIFEQLSEVRSKLEELETRQETTVLSVQAENKLIEEIRRLKAKLRELEQSADEQRQLDADIAMMAGSVQELFKKADDTHQEILKLRNSAKENQSKIVEVMSEVSNLIKKANLQHEIFIKLKEEASECTNKLRSMRQKVISEKKQRAAETEDAKKLLEEHRKKVRAILEDKAKLDEKAEQSLEELLKKGRISIG